VNGIPLQASLILVSADGSDWSLLEQWNPKAARFSIAEEAIQETLVNGRAGQGAEAASKAAAGFPRSHQVSA
jgi:hypothetical protein